MEVEVILNRYFSKIIITKYDTDPNVTLYHAYNDIKSYLTPGYLSDYSHSRKILAKLYLLNHLFPIFQLPYKLPSKTSFKIIDIRMENISKGKYELVNQNIEEGPKTYEEIYNI